MLFTIWCSNLLLEDYAEWKKLLNHLENTSKDFGLNYVIAGSSFRRLINESQLPRKVIESRDEW